MNAPTHRTTLLPLLLLLASAYPATAQTAGPLQPPPADAAQAAAAQASAEAPVAPQKPSTLIAPAIDHLGEVVSQVQLERWKSSSRDDTDANLRSVERNVSNTLPQLVTAADAQPASIVLSLPLLRNLNALCAVMVRVTVTAHANAPTQQAESLQGALSALESARNTLSEQVQTLAAAQEHDVARLRSTVATLTAQLNAPPPPPAAPAAKPAPKKKRKKPVAAKPASPAPTAPKP